MKIVFFGTGGFAVPALKAVAPHVVLVVSQPAKPTGRGMRVLPSAVERTALELGLPIDTPLKARDPEFIARVQALAPELFLVASYGQILRPALLEAATVAPINLHGSLLPKYRGAAPIQRAVLEGETETGITLMRMDAGMDTGDMIDIVRTPIEPDETYGELQDRLALLAADLAARWIDRLGAGDFEAVPQPEGATLAPKITKEDGFLDVARDAQAEYDRFRAVTPAPGASLSTNNGRLKLIDVRKGPLDIPPGTIDLSGSVLSYGFARGALELRTVQPEGKRPMSGRDFANGARLRTGDTLL